MASLSKKDLKRIEYLYYKKDYSAREVAKDFKVSIDCIYYFMRYYNLPRRTFFESNRVRFERKKLSFSLKRRLTEKEKQLKVAGIMLYWAEGAKVNFNDRNWTIDFANSNPGMVKLFLKFLRLICGVDEKRIRIYLLRLSLHKG